MANPLSFTRRSKQEELMDDLNMGGKQMSETLDQLSTINHLLGGYHILYRGISKLRAGQTQLRVADLGCGGGDGLRAISSWASKRKLRIEGVGYDANASVIAYARSHSQAFPGLSFEIADLLDPNFPTEKFDIIICSLILHHFDDTTLKMLLPRLLENATIGLLINDLHRSPIAYRLFQIATWMAGASHMIRHDGLISIQKGFIRQELKDLFSTLPQAKLSIEWRWAFRYLVCVHNQSLLP